MATAAAAASCLPAEWPCVTTADSEVAMAKANELKNKLKDLKISAKAKTEFGDGLDFFVKKIKQLEDELRQKKANENKQKFSTFASQMTSANKPNHTTKPTHAVVLKSKNNNEKLNSNELKAKIKQIIKPEKLKIGIKNFKSLPTGVLIECSDINDIYKIKSEIDDRSDLEARVLEKKLPKIIFYRAPSELTAEETIKCIINQNKELAYLKPEDFKFKFFMKTKETEFKHAIIEVKPEVRKIIKAMRRVSIDWADCKTEDFISVIRCFKCLGFGHLSKFCTAESQVCSNCSLGHSHKSCNSNTFKCVNCMNFNLKIKDPKMHVDYKHNALDKSKCQCYKKIETKITNQINFGE